MSGRVRHLRKPRPEEDDEEAGGVGASGGGDTAAAAPAAPGLDRLEALKLLQRARKRATGVDASLLASGAARAAADAAGGDPDAGGADAGGGGDVMGGFSKAAVSKAMDEDAHMRKYVEEELGKRLGKRPAEALSVEEAAKRRRAEIEAELYEVPEGMMPATREETVPGMVATITEVEVSVAQKLRSIEATEALKRRLLASGSGRCGAPSLLTLFLPFSLRRLARSARTLAVAHMRRRAGDRGRQMRATAAAACLRCRPAPDRRPAPCTHTQQTTAGRRRT